jgi:hypothetical protein
MLGAQGWWSQSPKGRLLAANGFLRYADDDQPAHSAPQMGGQAFVLGDAVGISDQDDAPTSAQRHLHEGIGKPGGCDPARRKRHQPERTRLGGWKQAFHEAPDRLLSLEGLAR